MTPTAGDDSAMPEFSSSSGVSSWQEMADWLADSLTGKPVAFILELGPQSFIAGGGFGSSQIR